MRVVLAAVGSRGDLVPFVALAQRLTTAGHGVHLVSHAAYQQLVPDGLGFTAVDSDPAALLSGPAGRAVARRDPRAMNQTRQLFADFVHAFAGPTGDALEGADCLVASTFALAPTHMGMQRGLPVVRAHTWPESRHPGHALPLVPYSGRLPAPVNRLLQAGVGRMERYLGGVNGYWRRGRLHLTARHPVGLATATAGSLHAYSPLIAGRPDAPDVVTTGWWWPQGLAAVSESTRTVLREPGPWGAVRQRFSSVRATNCSVIPDTQGVWRSCPAVPIASLQLDDQQA